MTHLTLVGLSADKTRLLLVDAAGTEHTLDVDTALRSALRGDRSRLGQLEIDMESALRPRDIQARIRAGETPEVVAQAAQTTVEKIMPFAAPVLAERAHVAERAQRASVRRKSSEAGARTLGEATETALREHNVNADAVDWDSWKRADGRWTLTAVYACAARTGTATFAFDGPGNFVVAEDDDARWLVGELPDAPTQDLTDDLSAVRRRRLTAVADDQLPLGDDAIELVTEAPAEEAPLDPMLGSEQPAEAFLDQVFAHQNPNSASAHDSSVQHTEPDFDDEGAQVDGAAAVEPETAEAELAEGPHRRQVRKTRGRASVPSWDEIMFGGGKSD
ncbi:MAG: septation protein SepH [Nocardioides sp.]|uniref:septation protein SepH n=1 Tax=Nocardioides sp. TaxID=35761 RepID=UPI0039E59E2E